jgi:hypothetical protein
MASIINTSRNGSLFGDQWLAVASRRPAVGGGTSMVDGGTLTIGGGTSMINGGTLMVGSSTSAVYRQAMTHLRSTATP